MKRSLLLLITAILMLFVLFSCKPKKNNPPSTDSGENGTNENGPSTDTGDAIYGSGIETLLITNLDITDSEVNDHFNAMIDAVYTRCGSYLYLYADVKAEAPHEIVIGDTNRPITAKAKEILANRIEKAARASEDYSNEEEAIEDTVGFAIYAEGGSVAVVWSDSHVFESAMNYFVKNYFASSSLKLENGYIKTETLSLSAFLTERGNRIREEQFLAVEEAIGGEKGKEIVASLKRLYSIYKPEAVEWLANLYDPITGGFYYSNSARDNQGFLPDIESTYGALAFVEEMGMAQMFDDDYTKALPEWLLVKIGTWIQSLQDEDGYFYHPQWPKAYINERGLQSRITRDRGSAITVLRKIGLPQVYPTSSGMVPGRLSGESAVVAASKVVACEGVLSQFESVESFRNYINKLDAEVLAISDPDSRAGRLYAIGNEFQSTTSLVKANPEYVKILHQFFKKHQDPNTGTWSSVLTYNATNSLHKIGYVYNSLGLKFDYMYEMIDTIIDILSRDVETDPISTGVDCANAWAAIEHIYGNIKITSATPAETDERLREVRNYIYAHITRAIDASFSQLAGFVQADGSIGYGRNGSSYVSQGCPAAVAGSAEGDVNGYGCASYSVTGYIFIALGLPEYEVDIFGEAERVRFVRILEKLGAIVKNEEELSQDVTYTFNDGKLPEEIKLELNSGNVITDGASVTVEEIDGEKVLHIVAVSRNGVAGKQNPSVVIPIPLTDAGANAAVVEFDFCVYNDGSTASTRMIEWAQRSSGTLVNYPTIGKTSAGKVMLYDSNGGSICELGNVDEEIKLTFVYFWAEGEYKVYVNDMFRAKGNTLYSSTLTNMPLTAMSFYSPTSIYANYYIDNLRASRVEKYNDPSETVQYPKEPVTEDFEGDITSEKYGEGYNVKTENGFSALYPDKYTNNGGATAVVREDEKTGNKFLLIYAPKRANKEYSHTLKMSLPTQMAEKPNVYVFEASLKLNSICTSRDFLQIVFLNTTGSYRYGQLNMTAKDSEILLAGVPIGYFDQWFDLRLEYHLEKGVIRVFSDDLFMGEITEFSQSDSVTNKKVSAITSITDFSVGTMNSSGSLSFSIDNMAISLQEIEYTEMNAEALPTPTPDKDDFLPEVSVPTPDPEPEPEPEPEPDPDPGVGGGTVPDAQFPGMEPPMELPDDLTPTPPSLDDREDMGDWTKV